MRHSSAKWPMLRDWLNQNRDSLILHRQLTDDANDWIKLGRDPGALYRGVRLKQMSEWVKTNADLISLTEQEFLTTSQKVAEEESGQSWRLARAQRVQIMLGSAAALLMIVVAVVILAVNGAFAPRKMNGIFNIAVAEFGEMGADGVIRSSEAGKQMSGWTVAYLRDELKEKIRIYLFGQTKVIFFGELVCRLYNRLQQNKLPPKSMLTY